MTNSNPKHTYQVGDAVLANLNDARIPGVVEEEHDGKYLVRLADPWTNDAGLKSDTQWLSPELLEPNVNVETGGEQALPRPS